MAGQGESLSRISSRHNPLVRATRDLLRASARRERAEFLAEGVKLVGDALAAGVRSRRVFVAPELLERRPDGQALLERLSSTDVVEVTPEILALLADTETSQGVVAVFPIELRAPRRGGHLLLVLDGIQDPGNVGTIVRSAVACGVVEAIAIRGGADPYGPKAVRAAAAALFHARIVRPTDEQLATMVADRPFLVADADAQRRYDAVDWRQSCALAIGSEAAGVSTEIRRLASGTVGIPLPGPVESLNAGVAASIILFEAARQVASRTTE